MTEDINRPAGDPRTLGQDSAGRPSPPPPPPPGAPAPVHTGPVATSGGNDAAQNDTKQAASEEASQVSDTAKQDAQQVAGTAKEEARQTAGEAKRQAQDLLRQSQSELNDQAGAQQQRLAEGLRTFSTDLGQMADSAPQQGMASHLTHWAAETSGNAGRWLEDRDPGAVLEDVRGFARRRPGMFILAAAGAGLLAGRVARGLRDDASDDTSNDDTQPTAGGTSTMHREPGDLR